MKMNKRLPLKLDSVIVCWIFIFYSASCAQKSTSVKDRPISSKSNPSDRNSDDDLASQDAKRDDKENFKKDDERITEANTPDLDRFSPDVAHFHRSIVKVVSAHFQSCAPLLFPSADSKEIGRAHG